MEHRSGKYFGAGVALRQISLATGGKLHRSVPANHVVLVRLTLDQFIFWPKLPPNAGFGIKNVKKFSGGNTPSAGGGDPSRTATCRARGCKLLCCWDLGLGNRSPKSKFTTTPLEANPLHIAAAYWLPINGTDRQMNTQVLQTLSAYCVASINNSIKNVPILVIFGTVFLPKTDDLKKFQLLHICCTATLISDKQYDRKG